MRNKYERLDKEGRKQAEKEFRKYDYKNKRLWPKYKRLQNIGIIGVIYSVIAIGFEIWSLITNYVWTSIFAIVVDSLLLLLSIFFIYQADKLFKYQVNQFLIERDRQKRKKEEEEGE